MTTDGTLFDMMDVYGRPFKTDASGAPKAASARNAIGDVAEQLACRALGYKRLRVDGRKKACADAERPDGHPVEIKSVGKNDRGLIYKFRLEKEGTEFPGGLEYVFVRHTCPVTFAHGSSVADFFKLSPPSLLITNHKHLAAILLPKPVRTFRMFTGEAGMTVAPSCQHCHGAPVGEPCEHCGTPPQQKFDRHTMHGSQRAGYVEGGWQFSMSELTDGYPLHWRTVEFRWRGQNITIKTATTL